MVKFKFKIGDKVRSTEEYFKVLKHNVEGVVIRNKIGDSFDNLRIILKDFNEYDQEWFELIPQKKEKIMEYRIKKKFYITDFMSFIEKEGIQTCEEYKNDIVHLITNQKDPFNKFEIGDNKFSCEILFEMIENRKYFREYMIKGGFIEEIKPEITYKSGDIFLDNRHSQEYMLVQINPNRMGIIFLPDGNRLHDFTVEVSHSNKVTDKEMSLIFKNNNWKERFTLKTK
jgi:hypothetical protein